MILDIYELVLELVCFLHYPELYLKYGDDYFQYWLGHVDDLDDTYPVRGHSLIDISSHQSRSSLGVLRLTVGSEESEKEWYERMGRFQLPPTDPRHITMRRPK